MVSSPDSFVKRVRSSCPTLLLVEGSGGFVVGAFVPVPWPDRGSDGGFASNSDASGTGFVFALDEHGEAKKLPARARMDVSVGSRALSTGELVLLWDESQPTRVSGGLFMDNDRGRSGVLARWEAWGL
jgi:hypothetical protein